jgi:hypothetical protein
MGDVRILHEEIVVADNRHVAMLAAAMDSDAFAHHVAIANVHPAWAALIADILRLVADDDIGMEYVALPDFGISEHRDVPDQPRSRPDPDASVKQAERADFDPVCEFDVTTDDGARMNARGGVSRTHPTPRRRELCSMKNLLLIFEVVRMFSILDGSAGHAVILTRPSAKIDHPATLRTERPVAIRRRCIGRFLADRTAHRSANQR